MVFGSAPSSSSCTPGGVPVVEPALPESIGLPDAEERPGAQWGDAGRDLGGLSLVSGCPSSLPCRPPSLVAAFDLAELPTGRSYALDRSSRYIRAEAQGSAASAAVPASCLDALGDAEGERLLLAHKPSPLPVPTLRKQGDGVRVTSLYLGGSRVDVPARRDGRPESQDPAKDRKFKPKGEAGDEEQRPKRSVITEFSVRSRSNLLRTIGRLPVSSPAYTFALTLPAEFEAITLAQLAHVFGVMARRFSAVRRFRSVSALWKRELQTRGALHWHFIFYGLECPSLGASVRSWMVETWLELLSEFFSNETLGRMRKVHAHSKNWIRLEGETFAHYFSKYLGKDPEVLDSTVPGRWWGSWNKAALPFVEETLVVLPSPVADDLARAFSKLRTVRATAGLNRSVARALPIRSLFTPGENLTPWDVQRLKAGYAANGRNPAVAAALLWAVRESQRLAGRRFGRWKLNPNILNTGSIVSVGASHPELAVRIIKNSCLNRGFPVPEFITSHEKKTQIASRSSAFLSARRAQRNGASQASFPQWSDSIGDRGSALHGSARRSAATVKRRRFSAAFAGVAEV